MRDGMRRQIRRVSTVAGAALMLTALPSWPVAAQPPSAAVADPDPGVRPTRLIDRDEIRVSRIDLQPGAVRSTHAHDDVEYHVWAPVSGVLEITIGTAAPVRAAAGQAVFLNRGTRHGFRNVGAGPAAVFEIFVKSSTARAGSGPAGIRDLLAALTPPAADGERDGGR